MNKQIFTLIILIGSSLNLVGQIFNRPIPEDFPKYEFRKPGTSSSEGYFLFTPIRLFQQSAPRHLAMFDDDGYLTWSANKGTTRCANFEYHPEFEVFSFASDDNSTSEMKFHIMDLSFSLIDSVVPTAGNQTDIHDFRILDNGNYLISGITSTNEDLSSYTFNGVQGANPTTVLSFVLQEFENGNLVFDWKSIDHIHPEEFIETYNYDSTGFDYVHGNAVEEDADGDFWISMRHTDALYKIDRVTGEILWTLGGQSSDFDFVNDDGFSGQHDIRVLPNGNLTLFDNGNSRSAPRFSRAVEYELDFTDSTATPVWEYQNEFNSYSRAMGSFRTNADDEHTIGYGFCYRPVSNLIHLDSQDEIISELLFQDSVVSYRALRAELTAPIERPEIVCAVAANQTTLSAPSGYSTYKWSTGEQSQQITVSETGTYQVWVNQGIGMLGSEPFFLDDLINPCGFVSTEEIEAKSERFNVSESTPGLFEVNLTGELTVLNGVGQIILQKAVTNGSTISLENQPRGVYLFVLERENTVRQTQRLLKF